MRAAHCGRVHDVSSSRSSSCIWQAIADFCRMFLMLVRAAHHLRGHEVSSRRNGSSSHQQGQHQHMATIQRCLSGQQAPVACCVHGDGGPAPFVHADVRLSALLVVEQSDGCWPGLGMSTSWGCCEEGLHFWGGWRCALLSLAEGVCFVGVNPLATVQDASKLWSCGWRGVMSGVRKGGGGL